MSSLRYSLRGLGWKEHRGLMRLPTDDRICNECGYSQSSEKSGLPKTRPDGTIKEESCHFCGAEKLTVPKH